MSLVHVYLFGKFQVRKGQQILNGFDARKAQELFCYLLLYQDRPHPREALADLLWSDSRADRPNRCLRKALWQLRAALDSESEPLSERVLRVEPDWIQLDPEAGLWLDVAVFEQAFKRIRGLQGRELDLQAVETLQNAVELYQGGLQESWYQDWYLYQRERFQHMYLVMLDKLMEYCEAHGSFESGLAYGAMILSCEPARERTHRRLMRLHYMAGDRTAALREYERCVVALKEELGVGPAKRTAALYQQIRMDQLSRPTLELAKAQQVPQATPSLFPLLLRSLSQLQAALGQIQQEIHQDIEMLEQAVDDQGQWTRNK
jgi:DNA-binding SARP family transcriptional activator